MPQEWIEDAEERRKLGKLRRASVRRRSSVDMIKGAIIGGGRGKVYAEGMGSEEDGKMNT